MTDKPQAAAIRERWLLVDADVCESWWEDGIRHLVRNCDFIECSDEPEHYGPDKYDGVAYAHAAADITYLLELLDALTE